MYMRDVVALHHGAGAAVVQQAWQAFIAQDELRGSVSHDIVTLASGDAPASDEDRLASYAEATDITTELLAVLGECFAAQEAARAVEADTEASYIDRSISAIHDALRAVNSACGNPQEVARAASMAKMALNYTGTILSGAHRDATRAEADLLADKTAEYYEEHLAAYEYEARELQYRMNNLSAELGVDTTGFSAMRNRYSAIMSDESLPLGVRTDAAVGVAAADAAQAQSNYAAAIASGDPAKIAEAEAQLSQALRLHAERERENIEVARMEAETTAREQGLSEEEIRAAGDAAEADARASNEEKRLEAAELVAQEQQRRALAEGLSEEEATRLATAAREAAMHSFASAETQLELEAIEEQLAASPDEAETRRLEELRREVQARQSEAEEAYATQQETRIREARLEAEAAARASGAGEEAIAAAADAAEARLTAASATTTIDERAIRVDGRSEYLQMERRTASDASEEEVSTRANNHATNTQLPEYTDTPSAADETPAVETAAATISGGEDVSQGETLTAAATPAESRQAARDFSMIF
jgi:hypothetical protein